jgi:hypothetical protein
MCASALSCVCRQHEAAVLFVRNRPAHDCTPNLIRTAYMYIYIYIYIYICTLIHKPKIRFMYVRTYTIRTCVRFFLHTYTRVRAITAASLVRGRPLDGSTREGNVEAGSVCCAKGLVRRAAAMYAHGEIRRYVLHTCIHACAYSCCGSEFCTLARNCAVQS